MLPAIIGAVGGLVKGIVGAKSSNSNTKKAIEAQREENEKTRLFNRESAELANKWSIDQWNRENEYNLPSNQVQRLRDAGLNPDLMYSNGAGSLLSAASPSVSQSSPASPTDMSPLANRKTVGDVLDSAMNASMQAAQVKLLDSQAKKNEADANKTNKETSWVDQLNTGTLELQNVDIDLKRSNITVNDAQRDQISKQIELFDQNIENMRQSISESFARMSDMDFRHAMSRLEFSLKESITSAQLRDMSQKYQIGVEELQRLRIDALNYGVRLATQDAILSQQYEKSKHDTRISELEKLGLAIRNGRAALDLERFNSRMSTIKSFDKTTGGLYTALEFYGDLLGSVVSPALSGVGALIK